MIDNINEILKVLVQQQLEIDILLENSASNNCYSATIPDLINIVNSINQQLRFKNKEKSKKRIRICFDIQHYYTVGGGKRIDEYQNIYNIYGHEIIVTHVNNSPLEVIFSKGIDKHAHIMDLAAKIPIEQIAQIHEVAKLREFANDVLNKETIQEEWSKEKDKELEQNKENYEGIVDISYGIQFEEPAIIDLADQMRCMTIHAQNEKPINKAQQKLNKQLIKEKQKAIQETISDTSRMGRFVKENPTQLERIITDISNLPDKELESHLGIVEKLAKININDKEEDRKKALYNINKVWKNKDVIEQIEEEYQFNKYTLLNITKEEFNQMPQWEQQIAIRNFLIGSEFSSEKVRKQFQNKYKELLASSLENQGKMHDDNEVEKRFVGKPQPEPFPPEGATHNRYILKENTYRERPVSPTSSEEDFSLKSKNIEEWLKSQAKEPPRPSSPIKDFVNKNIVDSIFKRTHERNSSTSSLPKILSSLKNKINLENDEEFKLQKPPIRYKRTRTVVSIDTNLSSTNEDKWKKEKDIRRNFFKKAEKKK
ncbi:23559_t:CDS:2 [Cetraspora pellucida]|uniref:23559_t:CDS:1 n=1 Tax=Cetraspora pellucida TaxID=1433469 RepID=A0A9N8WCW2_9GLOM|nr:23559_t:CDS:2 [Cetraspora pellucida]